MYVIVSICFVEKLGQPIVLPLRPKQKWCFVVNYWGGEKIGPAHSFPPEKWKHQPFADGYLVKTGMAHSFPTLTKHQPGAGVNLGGEKLGWSILFPPWVVKVSLLPCHEYSNNLCFLGGGEKLGRPILSPPWQDEASTLCRWLSRWRKTHWIFLSQPWLVWVSTLPWHEYTYNLCFLAGGEKLGRPILSPPWHDKASPWCSCSSGRRKTRLVHSFPTLTSESISLTPSWIHIQPLLFRGWGKTRLAHSFPTLTRSSINLVQMVILVEKNLAGPFFSHPDK